jgi:hypothetical protein
MLDTMGLSPRPRKDKDGKVIGYHIDQMTKLGKATYYLSVSGTGSSATIWVDANIAVFGDKNPATVALLTALLAEQDNLWPAYIVYYPKTKVLQLAMPLQNANPTPAQIQKTLTDFTVKCNTVLDTLAKVAKEDAATKEQGGVVGSGTKK